MCFMRYPDVEILQLRVVHSRTGVGRLGKAKLVALSITVNAKHLAHRQATRPAT